MNIFVVLVAILAISNSKIVMTKDQWIFELIKLAKTPSEYRANYPYNELYWDGRKFYCDAVNLNKVLFNGRNVRSLQIKSSRSTSSPDFSNVGDVGSEGLIRLCSDVSTNFTKLKAG